MLSILIFIFFLFYSSLNQAMGGTLLDFEAPEKASESFAIRVTRPFIADQSQNMDFFSAPKASLPQWNTQYRKWSEQSTSINTLGILETIGTSRRVLSLDPKYQRITDAQTKGMSGIIRGDLGFRKRAATDAEKESIARELLNLGSSLTKAQLQQEINTLCISYLAATTDAIRRHLQISALLMLRGRGLAAESTEWYLSGITDAKSLFQRIEGYADRFLEHSPADFARNLLPRGNYNENRGGVYLTACAIVEFGGIQMPAWLALLEARQKEQSTIGVDERTAISLQAEEHQLSKKNGWSSLFELDINSVATNLPECIQMECLTGQQAAFITNMSPTSHSQAIWEQIDPQQKLQALNLRKYQNPGPYPMRAQKDIIDLARPKIESSPAYKQAEAFVLKELKQIPQSAVIPGLIWTIRLKAEKETVDLGLKLEYIQCVQFLLSEWCIQKEKERRRSVTGVSLEYIRD